MKVINSTIAWMRSYPIAVVSILMAIAMSIFVPNFATATNLTGVGAQLSYIGISAVGLAFILIGGGLDLSLGTAMSASAVMSGLTMVNVIGSMSRISTPAGIIIIISTCIAFAAINGYFIAYWKINAFMMTLITQFLFKGLALSLTNSFSVTDLPQGFTALGKTTLLGVPVSIFVMFVFFIIGQLILSKTSYGRQLFATGANEKAAKLVGIPTGAVLFKAFLLGGLCNGVSAIILVGKLGVANPTMGNDLFLDIISAAVLGGNSLFGGKGSVVGAAFGVLLLGLISNGLNLLGVPYQITKIVKGAIILLAISMDMINERITARSMLKFSSTEDLKAHAKDL
jgi:ribose/xylose/arabinose/galactoside ABC-type transport system permease subunit